MANCPSCGVKITQRDVFLGVCGNCKNKLVYKGVLLEEDTVLKKPEEITTCAKCGSEINEDAIFCPVCGINLELKKQEESFAETEEIDESVCANCGNEITENATFCSICGANLKELKKAKRKNIGNFVNFGQGGYNPPNPQNNTNVQSQQQPGNSQPIYEIMKKRQEAYELRDSAKILKSNGGIKIVRGIMYALFDVVVLVFCLSSPSEAGWAGWLVLLLGILFDIIVFSRAKIRFDEANLCLQRAEGLDREVFMLERMNGQQQ
jgi:predicted amidophosphoribosyltransferase